MSVFHDDLEEGYLADEWVVVVVYHLGCCDENVKLDKAVPCRQVAHNGHVRVVATPPAQVLHALTHITIRIDQRLEIAKLDKEIFPDGKFRLGRDYQERPIQVLLLLETL